MLNQDFKFLRGKCVYLKYFWRWLNFVAMILLECQNVLTTNWEGVNLYIIMGDVHQFIGYCLISLDSWLFPYYCMIAYQLQAIHVILTTIHKNTTYYFRTLDFSFLCVSFKENEGSFFFRILYSKFLWVI